MLETTFIYVVISLLCVVTTSMTPRYIYGKSTISLNSIKYFISCFTPIIIYTLFWGLRENVGTDYAAYKTIFYAIDSDNERIEPIYYFLNVFFREIGFSHISIFILTSFISIWSLFYIARYESRTFACFLIYFFFTTNLVFFYQNGIRQSIAFSFLMILISRIHDYKLWKLCLLGLIAWGFHKSSLVPLAIILTLRIAPQIKINKYILIAILFFLTFFGGQLYVYIFSKFNFLFGLLGYTGYEENIDKFERAVEYSSGLGLLLKLFLNCLIIFYQDKYYHAHKKFPIYYVYIFFLIGILFEPIIAENDIMRRLNVYFINTKFIVFAYICSCILKTKQVNKKNQLFTIFIVFSCLLLYIAAILSNSNDCVPYKTIF